jgi:23S rRNA (pseudouridine1915-N3)-methyltransferase
MPIRVIAIGKRHEDWVAKGIERYQERLKRPFDVEWVLLPHSSLADNQARQEESQRILSRLGNDTVVLLDERGDIWSSNELSDHLAGDLNASKPVTFIIGGAYGVDDSVRLRANYVWSLSNLVLPHQLVRLVLIEQLYRSQTIVNNHPYHHS